MTIKDERDYESLSREELNQINMDEPLRATRSFEESMVERVAKAMAAVPNPGDSSNRYRLACARAAIEALREPTEVMMAAASDLDNYTDGNSTAHGYWTVMIGAALKSPSGVD